jgi:hypothetical protein
MFELIPVAYDRDDGKRYVAERCGDVLDSRPLGLSCPRHRAPLFNHPRYHQSTL